MVLHFNSGALNSHTQLFYSSFSLLKLRIIGRTNQNGSDEGFDKASLKTEDPSEKLIRLLEDQLAHVNEQNKALSKKLDQAMNQIEFLNQQLHQLTKHL